MEALEPRSFAVEADATLAGESVGEGPPILILHGLTATRRYVLHGSLALPRRGFEVLSYDARGHGESDPAPEGGGYDYEGLVGDLAAVVADRCPDQRPVLAGHSMGAHTAIAYSLSTPERVAGLALVGPASLGMPLDEEVLEAWDRLADGLDRDGVKGFVEAYDRGLDPEWRETLLRITRERLSLHRHPGAVARALREVPRSLPFEGMGELEFLDLPALVVASHDEADPSHPYAVAEEWSRRLPQAELVSEEAGRSPLAWQGGRLSRVIADFARSDAVAARR
jgi:pimeloyl-ACP methyl ester carboxylesterase